MKYYPVNLNVQGRRCLVVGGGPVATRKAQSLAACGAAVTVVSPETTETLAAMARSGGIRRRLRPYRESDLEGMFLVIGATDDGALNRRIYADAEARHMLCNIADAPTECNFILPAVVRRGDLILAVSTSGRSPAFARTLRKQLEKAFGEEYEAFLSIMGAIRERLLAERHEPEAHKPLFERLIAGDLLDLVREGRVPEIDALLADVLGPGYDYASLTRGDRRDST